MSVFDISELRSALRN